MGDSRSYRQSDYDRYDDRYEDSASRREGYGRDAPYDTLYKRSFEAVPDDTRSTRSGYGGSSGRSERRNHRRDSYDDDADRYYERQRQVGRPRDESEDDYASQKSQAHRGGSGYNGTVERSQRSRRSRGDSDDEGDEKKHLEGFCGKETKDIAATVVGALGGAFLGHEASHGRSMGALGGALLGGLSANAIEHGHLKREEKREERSRNEH